MFGPNCIPHSFSHRDLEFELIYSSTINLFKEKFNLSQSAIVVLITGSGTLANEIVLSSLRFAPLITTEGEFSQRLKDTSAWKQYSYGSSSAGVCYETAISRKNYCSGLDFVDCVSSFPYYPQEGRIWTTVSSKQLGAQTGLSIIVVENDQVYQDLVLVTPLPSYLSLARYVDKGKLNQTPNTPCISSIMSLLAVLKKFDLTYFRNSLVDRQSRLRQELARLAIRELGEGPVVTIDHGQLNEDFLERWNIYRNSGRPQIFTWSGYEDDFDRFIRELEGARS